MMSQTLKIFAQRSLEDDQQLSGLLSRLKNVEIIEVPEAQFLIDRVPLPFIETADGWRHVGIDAIRKFVADEPHGPQTMESARQNLELKATDPAPERTLAATVGLGCVDMGILRQRDTYFHARSGRLKLREEWPGGAHLIQYMRTDDAAVRASAYRIIPTEHPEELRAVLDVSTGIKLVVAKRRRLFLLDNVRIHLDQVEKLGCFIELEAVVPPGSTVREQSTSLARVRDALGIQQRHLVGESYSDLLELAIAAQY